MARCAVGGLVAGLVVTGCSLPEQRADFASDDPGERVKAVARAAREGDRGKARELVACLESSDPALRLMASRALFEMNAGETFGYDHTLPSSRQGEAMKRWRGWADLQKPGGAAGS